MTSGPLTILTLASLFFAWRTIAPVRKWWLAATAIGILERISTFFYFIPTMVELQSLAALTPEASRSLATWAMADYGRHILSAAAWLSALRALSLSSTPAPHTGEATTAARADIT